MNNSAPLLIGITGGIGAGKSTVAKVFSLLSIPIYSADDRAKWLMAHNEELKAEIIKAFGEQAYTYSSTVNRSFLAEKVFSDKESTEIINSLVHPAVRKDFEVWAEVQESPYVLKEAALLFETGSYQHLDKTINVSCPLKIRIARVLMRDPQRTPEQVNEIINRQLPDVEKNRLADFVIKNTENKMIIPQVLEIHRKLEGETA
jgi:dephospho-CoA kinase